MFHAIVHGYNQDIAYFTCAPHNLPKQSHRSSLPARAQSDESGARSPKCSMLHLGLLGLGVGPRRLPSIKQRLVREETTNRDHMATTDRQDRPTNVARVGLPRVLDDSFNFISGVKNVVVL